MNDTPNYVQKSLSDAGVLTLTFSRPEQLNAMNRRLMSQLIAALEAADQAAEVRVVVLTGAGRAFMAGADLKEYVALGRAEFDAFQIEGRRVYAAIENHAKPVIAAINGHCFGGGFEIALACDLLLATAGAKCGLPEINLGLIPGGGGTARLAQRAGLSRALEVVMTGRTVVAEELLTWGVVNHVFPAGEFAEQVARFAHVIAEKEPAPVQTLKRLAREAVRPWPSEFFAAEGAALGRLFATPVAQGKLAEFMARSEGRRNVRASQ